MLKEKVIVNHEKISKQVLENTETIATMMIIRNELLGEFERWERNEDKVKEELKHWVDQHPGEDTFVKWVCDTIEAVDKAQDEIVNKIVWKVYQTLINNRDSNKLWKAYEPKGNYYHRNHKMPLFERGGKENG